MTVERFAFDRGTLGRLAVVVAVVLGALALTSSPSSAETLELCTSQKVAGVDGPPPAPVKMQPYPTPLTFSGLTGVVTDVDVTLRDVTTLEDPDGFFWLEDLDVMLSAPVDPNTRNVILMSDAGGDSSSGLNQVTAADLTFDDSAPTQLPPDSLVTTGTYRPVDDDTGEDPSEQVPVDVWPDAPTPTNSTSLATFNGINPNGTWNLWVVDDYNLGATDIAGGYCLRITTNGTNTTTTSPSTTTTLAPTTTTLAPTTTTLAPTTTTLAPTTTTLAPTTTTLAPTTTTTAREGATCAGLAATIVGTSGNDTIVGTAGPDVIAAGSGDDTVNGLGGNDTICGEDGNDTLSGDSANDTLRGGAGNDRINGGGGDDDISGGTGNDSINAAGGNDRAVGNEGNDEISGGDGNDFVAGGDNDDVVNGGAGDDHVEGNDGNDRVFGGSGANTLEGNKGADTLNALDFGPNIDTLTGGPDTDRCFSGPPDTPPSLTGGDC